MDRIDIQKEVKPVNFFNLENQKESLSSAWIREKVEKSAYDSAGEIYKNEKGINCNAQMSTSLIQQFCVLDEESLKLLKQTSEKYGYSARVIQSCCV